MSYETILYQIEDGVAIIRLNRPKQLNAMNEKLMHEVIDACGQINEDSRVRAVLITGEGRAFSAGGDVAEIGQGYGSETGFLTHMELVNEMIISLAELSKPLVAAVNGVAAGMGMNTALCADIIFAAEGARFSEIFGNIGLVPDSGGSYLLARLIGAAKAKELIFTSELISAQRAYEMGVINRVVPDDRLEQEALHFAKQLAKGPTTAHVLSKKMVNNCFTVDLKTALHMEATAQVIASKTQDHKEGFMALHEKRKPIFTGQ